MLNHFIGVSNRIQSGLLRNLTWSEAGKSGVKILMDLKSTDLTLMHRNNKIPGEEESIVISSIEVIIKSADGLILLLKKSCCFFLETKTKLKIVTS